MRYWWVGPVFVLVLILGYSDPHAGASAAAPLPVAQAEEPRQGTPTPTPTVSCCPQPWSQRYESCAPGATPGTFNLTYRIELYNQCPHPIVGTAQDTLRVSTDYSHWDVLATSTPRPIVIPTLTPPGLPPSYSGGFNNVSVPDQYVYYELSVQIQPDGGCQPFSYYTWGQICRATPTPPPALSPTPQPPSPTVTALPPNTPTRTPTAPPRPTDTQTATPSNTPTALPTPCQIMFTDVPPGQPFYTYVYCLACQGVISGYADGTFRPYSNVTRGAAAKLVANAAFPGDPIPAGRQSFADVPGSFPFWLYIERLYGRRVVNGYGCGGPGEPCDAQQRPYFRPYADVTRGQLAKLLVLAAALPGPPTGQTFADVPPAHPFYPWVQVIAAYPIFSGYACGGPGEPCDDQHRPYFRSPAPATRGQTAKLVANTFYPGCGTVRR